MALGAPPALLAEVQRAALDEVNHTSLCLDMATELGAEDPQLGPFPFHEPIVPCANAVAVAVACVREGCVGETVGACLAEIAVSQAQDPAVRAVLEQIVADEVRHAALSWRIVAWLVRNGDPAVRAAVEAELQRPLAVPPAPHLWGREQPDAAALQSMLADIHLAVLEPAAELLLAA